MTVLSDAFRANAREIMSRYPQQRSALLMVLHAAQDEIGYVSDDVVREVLQILRKYYSIEAAGTTSDRTFLGSLL